MARTKRGDVATRAPDKFPGLDAIRERKRKNDEARANGTYKPRRPFQPKQYTPEELAAMPPSVRRRRELGSGTAPRVVPPEANKTTVTIDFSGKVARVGRPTKLTPELVEEFVKKFAVPGVNFGIVAQSLGVSPAAAREWLEKGAEPEFAGSIYELFAQSVVRSQAEARYRAQLKIAAEAKGWRGSAWILERVDPELRLRNDPQTSVNVSMWVDKDGKPRAEVAAFEARLERVFALAAESVLGPEERERLFAKVAELLAADAQPPAITTTGTG